MKSYERIRAVLNREAVDRTPVDLWCTPEVVASLKAHTGLDDELAVYEALGIDKIVWVFPDYLGSRPIVAGADTTNAWGVPLRNVISGLATYEEVVSSPIADFDSVAQLEDYPWPDPDLFDYGAAVELADRARSFGFATIGPWLSHFEIYCQLRGLENSLVDTIVDEDFLVAGLDRIEEIQTRMLTRYLTALGDRADLVFLSDDMGTQSSLLLSVETWETHFKPRVQRWCELVHGFGKRVLYHSDGACAPVVPGLIEAGIDVLNPIQHVCPGMELQALKERFGDTLIFHGGVENQNTLPFGTVDDVIAETRDCLDALGKGGGYIACSCHNIQAGTPVANILALVETVKRYG